VASGVARLASVAGVGVLNTVFWAGTGTLTVGVVEVAVLLSRPGPRPAAPGPGAGPPADTANGAGQPKPAAAPAVPPGFRAGDWMFVAAEPGGRTVGVRDSDGRVADLPPLRLPDGAALSGDGKRAVWVGTAD